MTAPFTSYQGDLVLRWAIDSGTPVVLGSYNPANTPLCMVQAQLALNILLSNLYSRACQYINATSQTDALSNRIVSRVSDEVATLAKAINNPVNLPMCESWPNQFDPNTCNLSPSVEVNSFGQVNVFYIPSPLTSDQVTAVKNAKINSIIALRQKLEADGVTVQGQQLTLDTTTIARINSLYLSLLDGQMTTINFWTGSSLVTMDSTAAQAFVRAALSFIGTCSNTESQHIGNVQALTTVKEINLYDISTGWPTN